MQPEIKRLCGWAGNERFELRRPHREQGRALTSWPMREEGRARRARAEIDEPRMPSAIPGLGVAEPREAISMLSPGSRDLAVLHRGPGTALRANFREERLCWAWQPRTQPAGVLVGCSTHRLFSRGMVPVTHGIPVPVAPKQIKASNGPLLIPADGYSNGRRRLRHARDDARGVVVGI